MNKKINAYTNRIFSSYLVLGLSYIVFIIILSIKVLPGFFMQIMFFTDEIIKGSKTIDTLILSSSFIQSILFGFLTLVLLFVIAKGISKSVRQFYRSINYINNFGKFTNASNLTIVKTSDYLVFTAGLIYPKIYISEALKVKLTKEQFNAVLFHELSHLKDHDPLRNYIVQLINNIMPIFPYKKSLFELFKTSVELKSDQNSESVLGKKKPIIEALYSILKHNDYLEKVSIASFSNSPERIPILVGKKKFNYKLATFTASILFVIAFALPAIAFTTSFYNCEHLDDCVSIFVNNLKSIDSKDLIEMHSSNSNPT